MRERFGLMLLFTLLLVPSTAAAALFGLFSDHAKVTPQGNEIRLESADLKPGQANFYRLEQEGKVVRFFVVRDTTKTLRAALDACDVCWREGKGYTLTDGSMVCVNCGLQFPLARVGIKKGGCNPHPLAFAMDNATITIALDELMAGASYFPENGMEK